jgi:bifunctional DNA-binding transcriptional regulator/antitoxin component of YhaV-PrlF toxin-antitoxin module
MAETKILKTDSRGRIVLPPPFRRESLFEYAVKGDQIILYPVRTVRKYPDMSHLPEEALSPDWVEKEKKINADTRPGIVASTPSKALRKKKN